MTPHAGFRLSIGGVFYMLTQFALEELERKRIEKE
jgi:hypothetical protein